MKTGIAIALGIGGAAGAYLLWKKFYGQGAVAGDVVTPYANSQLVAQPGLAYPFQAPQAARNDNQSEPWYGGSRQFNTQTAAATSPLGVDLNFMRNVNYVSGFADISSSLTSIWDDLGVQDWFGNDGDELAFTEEVSDFAGDNFSWDSLNMFA